MKTRIFLLLIAAAMVAFGVWSIFRRGSHPPPRPRNTSVVAPSAPVPIQDGKTLDFSSGNAVVKDSPADKAALERSVAEMDRAVGNVTFAPKTAAATNSPAPAK